MEGKMTIREALAETLSLLEDIRVPAGLIREIGLPVDGAITNLRACVEAIENQEREAEEEKADV